MIIMKSNQRDILRYNKTGRIEHPAFLTEQVVTEDQKKNPS